VVPARSRISRPSFLGRFPPASDSAHGTALLSGLAHVVRGIHAQSPLTNAKGNRNGKPVSVTAVGAHRRGQHRADIVLDSGHRSQGR